MTRKAYQKDESTSMAQGVYYRRVSSKAEDEALLAEEESWENLARVVDPDSPEAGVVRAQARAQLEQLVAGLPPGKQEIIRRRFLEDVLPGEIAQDLKITMPDLFEQRRDALRRLKHGLKANRIGPEDFEPSDPETR